MDAHTLAPADSHTLIHPRAHSRTPIRGRPRVQGERLVWSLGDRIVLLLETLADTAAAADAALDAEHRPADPGPPPSPPAHPPTPPPPALVPGSGVTTGRAGAGGGPDAGAGAGGARRPALDSEDSELGAAAELAALAGPHAGGGGAGNGNPAAASPAREYVPPPDGGAAAAEAEAAAAAAAAAAAVRLEMLERTLSDGRRSLSPGRKSTGSTGGWGTETQSCVSDQEGHLFSGHGTLSRPLVRRPPSARAPACNAPRAACPLPPPIPTRSVPIWPGFARPGGQARESDPDRRGRMGREWL